MFYKLLPQLIICLHVLFLSTYSFAGKEDEKGKEEESTLSSTRPLTPSPDRPELSQGREGLIEELLARSSQILQEDSTDEVKIQKFNVLHQESMHLAFQFITQVPLLADEERLAAIIINIEVWNLFIHQVRDLVWSQAYAHLTNKVKANVSAKLGDQFEDQKLFDQIMKEVWADWKEAFKWVYTMVDAMVMDQVGAQIGDQVLSQIRAPLGDEVKAQIGTLAQDQATTLVRDYITAQIEDQVRLFIEPFFESFDSQSSELEIQRFKTPCKLAIHYTFLVYQLNYLLLHSHDYKQLASYLRETLGPEKISAMLRDIELPSHTDRLILTQIYLLRMHLPSMQQVESSSQDKPIDIQVWIYCAQKLIKEPSLFEDQNFMEAFKEIKSRVKLDHNSHRIFRENLPNLPDLENLQECLNYLVFLSHTIFDVDVMELVPAHEYEIDCQNVLTIYRRLILELDSNNEKNYALTIQGLRYNPLMEVIHQSVDRFFQSIKYIAVNEELDRVNLKTDSDSKKEVLQATKTKMIKKKLFENKKRLFETLEDSKRDVIFGLQIFERMLVEGKKHKINLIRYQNWLVEVGNKIQSLHKQLLENERGASKDRREFIVTLTQNLRDLYKQIEETLNASLQPVSTSLTKKPESTQEKKEGKKKKKKKNKKKKSPEMEEFFRLANIDLGMEEFSSSSSSSSSSVAAESNESDEYPDLDLTDSFEESLSPLEGEDGYLTQEDDAGEKEEEAPSVVVKKKNKSKAQRRRGKIEKIELEHLKTVGAKLFESDPRSMLAMAYFELSLQNGLFSVLEEEYHQHLDQLNKIPFRELLGYLYKMYEADPKRVLDFFERYQIVTTVFPNFGTDDANQARLRISMSEEPSLSRYKFAALFLASDVRTRLIRSGGMPQFVIRNVLKAHGFLMNDADFNSYLNALLEYFGEAVPQETGPQVDRVEESEFYPSLEEPSPAQSQILFTLLGEDNDIRNPHSVDGYLLESLGPIVMAYIMSLRTQN